MGFHSRGWSRTGRSIGRDSRLVVVRDRGKGTGEWLLMEIECLSGVMKDFWKWMLVTGA